MTVLTWQVHLLSILGILAIEINAQSECPPPWKFFEEKCYRFSLLPLLWEDAMLACQKDESYLVAVDNPREHAFIQDTLRVIDGGLTKHVWYTGGRKYIDTSTGTYFQWIGTGASVSGQFWMNRSSSIQETGDYIAYVYSDYDAQKDSPNWFWLRHDGSVSAPYICEIFKTETAKVFASARNFSTGADDVSLIRRGPYFVRQPASITYDSSLISSQHVSAAGLISSPDMAITLECEAYGVPSPSYTWMSNAEAEADAVTGTADRVIQNGTLTIYAPQAKDSGEYWCIATNPAGSIRSSTARITFQEFGVNESMHTLHVIASQSLVLVCGSTSSTPAEGLHFYWYKHWNVSNYVNGSNYPHVFASSGGQLYFSYITEADDGIYTCQSSLAGGGSLKHDISSYNVTVTSDGNKLGVPFRIGQNFPKIFPERPSLGDTVRLECWASGTTPPNDRFAYHWTRQYGKSLPRSSTLSDYNRVLTIKGARYEDQGVYNCSVIYNQAMSTALVSLSLQSIPIFGEASLLDTHANNGADFTWACRADGIPLPTYSWLKNGRLFSPQTLSSEDARRIFFSSDLTAVRFKVLEKNRDQGMYQCAATNTFGTVYSSAQLRVLEFAPTFSYHILSSYASFGAAGVTIPCVADGSPTPTIEWRKDGSPIAPLTNASEKGGRIRILENGYLSFLSVVSSDEGNYSCTAKNTFGSATLHTSVFVLLSFGGGALSDAYVDDGANFTWSCLANGPAPTYSWQKNGQPFSPGTLSSEDWQRIVFSNDLTTIRFETLNKSRDQGRYRCSAVNEHGAVYSYGDLNIRQFAPTFPKHLRFGSIRATTQDSATIPCEPEGAPRPIVEWRKDGSLMRNPPTDERVRLLANGDVFIRSVELSDAGNYSCKAENTLGAAVSFRTLVVSSSASTLLPVYSFVFYFTGPLL